MPDNKNKQPAPDFIPAEASPDFIPADGGQQAAPDDRGIVSKGIDAAGNALNNFSDALIGTHTNEGVIKGFTEGIPQMVKHPIDSAKLIGSSIIGAHTDTANNAIDQMKQPGIGNKIVGAGRYIQSGIPLIGPQLDKAGQQLQSGDVSGGIGTTLGVGSMIAGPKMGEVGARGIGSVSRGIEHATVRGTPEQILTRATKPTVGLPEYEQSLKAALPEIAPYKPKNLNDLALASDKIKAAKNAEYQDLITPLRKQPINLNGVADAQVRSIPPTDLLERPSIISKTESIADRYRPIQKKVTIPSGKILDEFGKPFIEPTEKLVEEPKSLGQADDIRVDTNAKLRSFWNKAGGDKVAALSDPETARTFAVNNGVRDAVYDHIKRATGVDPRPIQETYGHAVDIGDTAARRNTVFSRQQPVPLVSQIAGAHASPAGFALSKFISGLNDSDALVDRAFKRYNANIGAATMPRDPVRSVIAGPGKLRRDED